MKDRNLICKYYICAGVCSQGKSCSVWSSMQHCGSYVPDLNSKPLRENNKREKLEKIRRKENGKRINE